MAIQWARFTQPDGRDYRHIRISEQSDWSLFDQVAQILEVGLGGTWTQKVDGTDERYWDIVVGEGKLTLHLQHYLGISAYPTAGVDADGRSLDVLEQAYELLVAKS